MYEDRQCESPSSPADSALNVKCRCDTADSLVHDLKQVEARYYEVIELGDRAAMVSELNPLQVTFLI